MNSITYQKLHLLSLFMHAFFYAVRDWSSCFTAWIVIASKVKIFLLNALGVRLLTIYFNLKREK